MRDPGIYAHVLAIGRTDAAAITDRVLGGCRCTDAVLASRASDIGADTPKLPDSYLESLRAGVAKSVNAAVLKTAARKGLRVQLPPPAVPIDSNPREMPQCAVRWTNARCYGGAATW